MTATTVPQNLPARTWNSLLKLAALLAVAVVLMAGSFAIGQRTADDATPVVTDSSASAAPADVPPAATDASCGRTAHTPPC
jgi:hypothetical protein